MNGAELLIKLLEKHGVEMIAGIPGGANLPIYSALYDSKIKHILVRHEQAAGFIAQGISRTKGKAGVCFATSGPGATNILTAIADAKLDSIPIIAITGQVPYKMIGTDAFQEVDTYGLTVPITKHNFIVRDANELYEVIPEAFSIALSGRPGPVLIDIPKDVQSMVVEEKDFKFNATKIENEVNLDIESINKAIEMINNSEKPILYIGGGITNSNAAELIKKMSFKNNIPVTLTLMGLGTFEPDNPLYLGMLGMHGSRYTNKFIHESDLLIALGVRFDDRATGNMANFCPKAKIIHIDIDYAEINKVRSSNVSIVGDVENILKEIVPKLDTADRNEWISKLNKYKELYPFKIPDKNDNFNPINIIKGIGKLLSSNDIITTDVGQHQMWAAQVYPVRKPRTFLTSGGLGTMGFGLPTAIGAALANPEKTIVCISGDGSLLMNIQEFATLADLKLNIKVVLLNNNHLGLVRQQQEMFYDKKYIASKFDSTPDFAQIAKGFGINGIKIEKDNNPLEIIKECIDKKGPYIIDIPIDFKENVVPIVPPGKPNYEMIGGE